MKTKPNFAFFKKRQYLDRVIVILFLITLRGTVCAQDQRAFQVPDFGSPQTEYAIPAPLEVAEENYSSGLVFKPFELSESTQKLWQPVLYGPGGDPLAGIDVPVSENLFIVILLGIVYAINIRLKKKTVRNN